MSYCRFASDGGKSDVYIYASGIDGKPVWCTDILATTKLSLRGQTFFDSTLAQLAMRLEQLRKDGYHIPQKAIDRVNRECETEYLGL